MNDDWTTPTGEYEQPGRETPTATSATRSAGRRHGDAIDPALDVSPAELRIVDAFFYELALEAAEDPSPPNPREQLAIDNLRARFERLQAMTPEEQEAERQRLLREGW